MIPLDGRDHPPFFVRYPLSIIVTTLPRSLEEHWKGFVVVPGSTNGVVVLITKSHFEYLYRYSNYMTVISFSDFLTRKFPNTLSVIASSHNICTVGLIIA